MSPPRLVDAGGTVGSAAGTSTWLLPPAAAHAASDVPGARTLADRARAAILACPGHWTPATLARQLRVDVAELEPALASLSGLVRDTWRGVLSLPPPPRRERRPVVDPVPPRPVDERVAVVRHLLEAGPLTRRQVSDALGGLSPQRTHVLLRRAGAQIAHHDPGRTTLWGLPGVQVSGRESLGARARRLLEQRPRSTPEVAAELQIPPNQAWQVLRRIGATHEGYASPWRLP